MPKKFFDIIPPEEVNSFRKEKIEKIEPIVKKKKYFLKSLFFLVSILVLLGLIGSFFFSNIKVEIWPKVDVLTFEEAFTVSIEILEDQRSGSQEFSASGKSQVEQKAKGIIRVYNAYSASSRTLIPSRFVSSDGKLFWSIKKITIPGVRYEKGKLVPGEKDVEVEAAEPGEEYNIPASTFALPALAGTALYTTIYGRSFSPMTGGFKGETDQITQADLNSAENILLDKLKKESREFLKTSLPDGLILLDQAISYQIIESKSSQEAEAIAESFNFEAKVKSQGIAFKKSDIEELIKDRINLDIMQGRKIQEETLEINYYLKEIDLENKRITLNLDVKVKIYSDIELDKVKKALLGKKVKEARIFLENLPEVFRVELKSWPFLKRKIPEDIDRVEVLLRLD